MKILGIIPARGGSKGIPGKNIKPLAGKPLLAYTFEAARKATGISKLILSSDDPEIIAVAQEIGLETPFVRPLEISTDNTPSLEVILHALEFYSSKGESFDAVCLLQVTSPFRRRGLLDEAIKKFQLGNHDSLISVREIPAEYNPHWAFEEKDGKLVIATGEGKIVSRRQDLPKAYHRDGAVYLTKTQLLLNEKSLYGRNMGYIDTSGFPYVNIDSPADWKEAEKLLNML